MNKLDSYKFSTKNGFNGVLIKLRYEVLRKYFKGSRCLELGSADGEGTKDLIPYFKEIVAVDGSSKAIKNAQKEIKDKKVTFLASFFEDFKHEQKFDTVLLLHVLEHVDDPVKVLKVAKKLVKKDGVIIIDVPNAKSIHRQAGVLMGLLKSEYELNKADLSIGHQRVYDLDTLAKDVKKAGLQVSDKGGMFLKAFSNSQLEKILDKNGIMAFNQLGQKFPEISAEIFIIAKLKK